MFYYHLHFSFNFEDRTLMVPVLISAGLALKLVKELYFYKSSDLYFSLLHRLFMKIFIILNILTIVLIKDYYNLKLFIVQFVE